MKISEAGGRFGASPARLLALDGKSADNDLGARRPMLRIGARSSPATLS
jgi:hypothetical protein